MNFLNKLCAFFQRKDVQIVTAVIGGIATTGLGVAKVVSDCNAKEQADREAKELIVKTTTDYLDSILVREPSGDISMHLDPADGITLDV